MRKGEPVMAWVRMGISIANIYRYAQVAKDANTRYLNALSSVKSMGRVREELESICKRVKFESKN